MEKVNSEECFADEDDDVYGVVVIGSGYGGSVAACRLSMAGLKVCLMEKGKKWDAQYFPSNSWKMLSTLRMESRSTGISSGPKDGLFQVYQQDDSLAAMACGLGGGSLMNAGVMMPIPVHARRNPKWPEEWETDWEACMASASSMLRLQSISTKFPNAKTMRELMAGEENERNSPDLVNVSINFDVDEQPNDSGRSKETAGSC